MDREQMIAHLTLQGWRHYHSSTWQGLFSETEGLVFFYTAHPSPNNELRECLHVRHYKADNFSHAGAEVGEMPDDDLLLLYEFIVGGMK